MHAPSSTRSTSVSGGLVVNLESRFLLEWGPALRCDYPSGRIRTRPGSMTEKLPVQSSRALISAASRSPASSGFGIGIRINTTPQVRGSTDPRANSPKSLSKVSKIRCSRAAPCQPRGQHVGVGHAWRNGSDPHDIVPGCRQGGDRRGRKILVGEKTQNQAALGNTFSKLSVSRA